MSARRGDLDEAYERAAQIAERWCAPAARQIRELKSNPLRPATLRRDTTWPGDAEPLNQE